MTAITPDTAVGPDASRAQAIAAAKHWGLPIMLAVIAVLSLILFGLRTPEGVTTTFSLSRPSDAITIAPIVVASRMTAIMMSLLALAVAGYAAWRVYEGKRIGWWAPVLYGVLVMTALLSWAGAGKTD